MSVPSRCGPTHAKYFIGTELKLPSLTPHNPDTCEVESAVEVQGLPEPCSEFKVSLG